MAVLKTIEVPFSALELAQGVNDNITELDAVKADRTDLNNYIPTSQKGVANGVAALNASGEVTQKAASAKQADDYNTSSGTIQQKFGSTDSEITNIKNGNTTVGKARELDPLSQPGNNKVYGTSPSGIIGWLDMPTPGGDVRSLYTEPFTSADSRWSSAVAGIYTLTIPHAGAYPIAAFKQDGAVYSQVSVDIQRDNTNVLVRAMNKFAGYIVMG